MHIGAVSCLTGLSVGLVSGPAGRCHESWYYGSWVAHARTARTLPAALPRSCAHRAPAPVSTARAAALTVFVAANVAERGSAPRRSRSRRVALCADGGALRLLRSVSQLSSRRGCVAERLVLLWPPASVAPRRCDRGARAAALDVRNVGLACRTAPATRLCPAGRPTLRGMLAGYAIRVR